MLCRHGMATHAKACLAARSPQGGGVEAAHAHGALLWVGLQHFQGDGAVGAQNGGALGHVLMTRGRGGDRMG